MLAHLVRNRHRVVPKDELLRELWPDAAVTDASRAVSLARRALRPADRELVRTHARHGYRFVGELAEVEPDPADAAAASSPHSGPERWSKSSRVSRGYSSIVIWKYEPVP